MFSTLQTTTLQPATDWSPVKVNLDTVDIPLLMQLLKMAAVHHPQLAIECSILKRLRTRGVCEVVSQLVALRQAGATIHLRNVSPVLYRALRLLQLDSLFSLAG